MKIIDIESVPRKKSLKDAKGDAMQKGLELFNQDKLSHGSQDKRPTQLKIYAYCVLAFGIFTITMWGIFFYRYKDKANTKAQHAVFEAVYDFEQGNFEQALQGSSSYMGFLNILEQYPHTNATALVRLYTGIAYMHQKNYDKAIACLESCYLNSTLVQARVFCLLGDAYSNSEQFLKASQAYIKAANCANSVHAPSYWIKAALVLQKIQQYKQAYDCYQHIINNYPKASVKPYALEEAARLALLL